MARLKAWLDEADTIVIGAGSGLSTAAGFTYAGTRFEQTFFDFMARYGLTDMYSGGFYPFASPNEFWAYWSRYVYINRYMDAPKPVYEALYELVKDKDYFVLTTNVDHCFQKAGFDRNRLFYTQGDYGLFQCSTPCHDKTYDNEKTIRAMVQAQGFAIDEKGGLFSNGPVSMSVPDVLVPHCPVCGKPMAMNLRSDSTFVEDDGWRAAAKRYRRFLDAHEGERVLFLELGVGFNTPGIIKYPFWDRVLENPNARLATIDAAEILVPASIESRTLALRADLNEVLESLYTGSESRRGMDEEKTVHAAARTDALQ